MAIISYEQSVCYRGRFAPSPTGPLHFGSLLAAVASYLEARQNGGEWLLRIEDIDTPRNVPGAADAILFTLDRYGFRWDGPVVYQSERLAHYQAALERLIELGLTYPCTCSRRELAEKAEQGASGRIYPGFCRTGPGRRDRNPAIRVRTDDQEILFEDAVQGVFCQRLESEVGDFVIRRVDDLFAYQLVVVVDDGLQGVTDIVRGSDLLDSTPRQMVLQQALGYAVPGYAHIPVIVGADGAKLSKQTGAAALPDDRPGPLLTAALAALGQQPPPELARAAVETLWQWAFAHWRLTTVPRYKTVSEFSHYA